MDGRMAGWPDADGELAEMRQEEEEPFLPSTRDALFTLMEIPFTRMNEDWRHKKAQKKVW